MSILSTTPRIAAAARILALAIVVSTILAAPLAASKPADGGVDLDEVDSDGSSSVRMTNLEPAVADAATEAPSVKAPVLGLYAKFGYDWLAFKTRFRKAYADAAEEARRFRAFAGNLLAIEGHNKAAGMALKSYRLGINQFADMEVDEFRRTVNGYGWRGRAARGKSKSGIAYLSPAAATGPLPSSVDWRSRGAVTPIKDQGQCGSCWSFSSTGALEGQTFRKTGRLVSLSEQQLVDCSASFGNAGCNGGLMDEAFQYAEKFGLELEAKYPYKGVQADKCGFNSSLVVATCTGFVDLPAGSEEKLQEAVANIGPVSIAIDASHHSFQLYRDGVYDEPACKSDNLDHGVLVVGYGIDVKTRAEYWLVKNSWNVHWGEAGYVRIARNRGNKCGVASAASYPTV